MKAHIKTRAGAAFALTLTLALIGMTVPTAASAADGDTTPAIVRPGLAPCVDMAAKTKASAWVCTAEGLNITADIHGKTVDKFIPLKSTDYNAAPATPTTATSGTLSTMAVGDDYDYWCETGTICHRYPSRYAEETKRERRVRQQQRCPRLLRRDHPDEPERPASSMGCHPHLGQWALPRVQQHLRAMHRRLVRPTTRSPVPVSGTRTRGSTATNS